MTDHYRAARTELDNREDAAKRLRDEYSKPMPDPKRIARLHDERNTALQLAKVHSQLAVAQAIADRGIGA